MAQTNEWGPMPRGPRGRRLMAVVQALRQLWDAGDTDRCVRNLPLLAEKLDDCGLHYEAAAARLPWTARKSTPSNTGVMNVVNHLRADLSTEQWNIFRYRHCSNARRIFWFRPGDLDAVVSAMTSPPPHFTLLDRSTPELKAYYHGASMHTDHAIHHRHGLLWGLAINEEVQG